MAEAVRDRYVYSIDREDGSPCYIGVGKGGRMHFHVNAARRGHIGKSNPKRYQYFIDCLARGFEPKPYKIAEELTIYEATSYEEFLIAWYGRLDLGTGCLLNASSGGFGVKNHAPSTRANMSIRAKKYMAITGYREAIAESNRTRICTEETREKRAENMRKRTRTEEGRAAARELGKRPKSAKTRAVMAESARNRPKETNIKIGEATKRRMAEPGARKALSEALKRSWIARRAAKNDSSTKGN